MLGCRRNASDETNKDSRSYPQSDQTQSRPSPHVQMMRLGRSRHKGRAGRPDLDERSEAQMQDAGGLVVEVQRIWRDPNP